MLLILTKFLRNQALPKSMDDILLPILNYHFHKYFLALPTSFILNIAFSSSGIRAYYKECAHCGMVYRYQEYMNNIHNFDNVHLFSINILQLIRPLVKVCSLLSILLIAFNLMVWQNFNLKIILEYRLLLQR